jgi:hypothetical protein
MGSLDACDDGTNGMASKTSMISNRSSINTPRKMSSGAPILIPLSSSDSAPDKDESSPEIFKNGDLDGKHGSPVTTESDAPWNTIENIAAIGLSLNAECSPQKLSSSIERFTLDDDNGKNMETSTHIPHYRFHKWIKTLQKKAVQRRRTMSGSQDNVALERDLLCPQEGPGASRHKKSLSGSSLGFVTAVKSASISLASFSVDPRSRRTGISSRHQRTDHSSRASNVGVRLSEDSSYLAKGVVMDEATNARSIQRRQVLEEIISTEEGYIADVKFLMNV